MIRRGNEKRRPIHIGRRFLFNAVFVMNAGFRILLLLALTLSVGCTGGVEKNKYKDLDRPKPADRPG